MSNIIGIQYTTHPARGILQQKKTGKLEKNTMKLPSKQGRVSFATITMLTVIIAASISLGADKVAAPVDIVYGNKAGDGVSPHFMALLACARELRQIDPGLFLNVTVGTWPSPFWLNVIDCTWREGSDMGWEGKGDDREMWLNYRDAQTYRFVVKQGPLYPLNSIMNHGIVMAKGHLYAARAAKAGNDLRNEARSFFGSGTALQELYIQPDLMATSSWDTVASAAKWAKLNADVLVDTHWVGGDPSKPEIYGWASWTPKKALLTLRNPNDQAQEIKLDAGVVFELPVGAAKNFTMTSPYADQRVQKVEMTAGKPTTFALQPFEVLVLESKPTTAK